MDYAWSQHGMIHGDIKPGNILISQDHVLKVGDLGLARSSNGATGDPADVMITPLYAAPEVIAQQCNDPDPRSDIYSFGVMFYELACGKAPFIGSVEQLLQCHMYALPEPLFSMNPDMDRELTELIDSMLAKNPDMRPANWKKVRAALEEIYNRLFPAPQAQQENTVSEAAKLPQFKEAVNSKSFSRTSWSAEKKEIKLLEKFPWLVPALLILIILAALISIPITLGLFE
jgi:serine/threonine protein kinase